METVQLTYSENVIRDAIRTLFKGWVLRILFLIGLQLAGIAYFLSSSESAILPVSSVVTVFLPVFLVMGAIYIGIHYMGLLSLSQARISRLKKPEVTLELQEEAFRFISEAEDLDIKWSKIKRIYRYKSSLMLCFAGDEFGKVMIIPTSDLSPALCSFIVSKAETHGAKIA